MQQCMVLGLARGNEAAQLAGQVRAISLLCRIPSSDGL
jgi:hypothetical protein